MPKQSTARLRKSIEQLELKIQTEKKRLAQMRQSLPPLEVADYEFTTKAGGRTKLSKLFGKHDELLLIHNMGVRCAYCTMWADGFNGLREHLANRTAFVVVSPDQPKIMSAFAKSRNWKFPIYSHAGTSFGRDLEFADEKGNPWPGVSTFFKNPDGRIYRVAYAYFGPGDDYCATWHLFDLLPRGTNKWGPKFSYKK